MEEIYKPVPDVECLKYHGTPEKPDIKIFVSHRIDLDSETIDDPLYIPVRCGAALDAREDVTMLGDDTGDNISEKRATFSELTVLYWMWKNIEADYYGLNQYRRYFSFSPKKFFTPNTPVKTKGASLQCVIEDRLNKKAVRKYRFNEMAVRKQVESYDLVVTEEIDLEKFHRQESNFIQMAKAPHAHILSDFDVLKRIVSEKYPEYMEDFDEYFLRSPMARWYNCFIMKKDIFHEYCKWLFDILFEFEKRISIKGRSDQQKRAAAYMGERLTGLYICRLIKQGIYKYRENQLVFFKATENLGQEQKLRGLKAAFKLVFPYGSRPYVFFKRFYFQLKGEMYDPAYDMAHREYGPLHKFSPAFKAQRQMRVLVKEIRASRNPLYQIMTLSCWANEIRDLHKETFGPYRYCNYGKDVVIIATGPTLSYYQPIKDAKHLGVNGACAQNIADLDYYFLIDGNSIGRTLQKTDIKNLKCDKFIGRYYEKGMFYRSGTSEALAWEVGAKRFIVAHVHHYKEICPNIEYFPLMEGWTVTATAMHFAFHTHPRRIFLVGNDASTALGEHFDNSTGGDNVYSDGIKRIYRMIKQFAERYYPDIEIISVNPVGLKGMFRDVYTQSYLDAHPEAKRGIGRYYELLEDVVNEPPEEESI